MNRVAVEVSEERDDQRGRGEGCAHAEEHVGRDAVAETPVLRCLERSVL